MINTDYLCLTTEPTMSDRHGSKRPSDQDRIPQLQQKFVKTGEGSKGRTGTSALVLSSRVPAPSNRAAVPSNRAPSNPLETQASHPRKDQPVAVVPSSRSRQEDTQPRDSLGLSPGAESIRWKSSTQKEFVSKFDDRLTSNVAELSRRSDPVGASIDLVDKLVEVSFSSHASYICLILLFIIQFCFMVGRLLGLLG